MNNNNLESLAEEVLEAKAKEIYGKGWQKALTAFRILAESEPLISNITLAAMKEMYQAGQQSQKEEWVKEKPDKECVFIAANPYRRNNEHLKWDYSMWQIKYLEGEDEEGNPALYLGLLNGEGEEWGPLEDLEAEHYKIISTPPIQTN